MSLKIEQRLCGKQITEFEPCIYSNGVSLIPMSIELNGKVNYIWVANDFNAEVFDNNGNSILVRVIAEEIENLYI